MGNNDQHDNAVLSLNVHPIYKRKSEAGNAFSSLVNCELVTDSHDQRILIYISACLMKKKACGYVRGCDLRDDPALNHAANDPSFEQSRNATSVFKLTAESNHI